MAIGTRLTIAGAVLLAKALNGKPLNFTRGAFGDAVKNGATVVPTSTEQDALTALIRERMTLPIKDYEIKENGDMIVTVSVKNASVATEFKMIEIGLFAKDPDTGQELLYGYSYDADGGKMYAKNSAVALEYLVDLVTTIGNASNVSVVYGVDDKVKPGIGMTRSGDTLNVNIANTTLLGGGKIGEGLHMDNDSITANTASATKLGSIKVGKGLYMEGDSLCASVESIAGGEAEQIQLLNSRLAQMEINQSNLFMKLEAENDLGMTANLLLVEDFIDKDCIDQTSVPINYTSSGDTVLKTKANIKHLEVGNTYTAVYHAAEERFKMTTIERYQREDGYWQFRPAPSKPFLSNDTVIYRTTATIKDNAAYGPGQMKGIKTGKKATWYGEGDEGTRTVIALDTSSVNSSKFTITEDGWLDSNGYFTLV